MSFFMLPPKNDDNKIKNLSLHKMPGQDNSCGATLLGALAPSLHVLTYADPDHGRSSRLVYLAFAVPQALRSPFGLSSSVAIPAPAALCVMSDKAPSLSVSGLCAYCSA